MDAMAAASAPVKDDGTFVLQTYENKPGAVPGKYRVVIKEDMSSPEAIKRGGNVAIQKLPNTTDCLLAVTDNDWGCGWEVFVDTDGDSTRDAGEEVLQSFSMPVNITVTRTGGGAVLNLDRWGRINGAFTGFSLVPLDKPTTDAAARGLCMGAGGRIRVINPAEIPCTAG